MKAPNLRPLVDNGSQRKRRAARAPSVTDDAIDKIRERIVSGAWGPGDRLPNESELAAELGLSRARDRKPGSDLAAGQPFDANAPSPSVARPGRGQRAGRDARRAPPDLRGDHAGRPGAGSSRRDRPHREWRALAAEAGGSGSFGLNPTARVRLGRTPLDVTRLGFGTAPLGGLFQALADDDAHRVVEAAWSAGIRFFDTAPQYGNGLAEQRLGAVLGTKPRDQFVLATKVGRLLRAGAPPQSETFPDPPRRNPLFGLPYDGVMRSVEESVARLGIDRIDILHIHDPDEHFAEALAGAYPALDRLRSEGTIKAVGAGMNQAEMLARLAREANFDCFLLAGRYTVLDQVGLKELLPLCVERGIAIIAGGVFNSGILADPRPGTHYNYQI